MCVISYVTASFVFSTFDLRLIVRWLIVRHVTFSIKIWYEYGSREFLETITYQERFSSRIPLGHPNVAGAISGYKAVVAQPSSLGILWHAHIWNLHAGVFRAFRRTSCAISQQSLPASAPTFRQEHSFSRAVTPSKRQARLVKIEFQSVPS